MRGVRGEDVSAGGREGWGVRTGGENVSMEPWELSDRADPTDRKSVV